MLVGQKKEPEIFAKAYVEKANLKNVHVFPVPEDLENWIEIDFDENFDYTDKVYDVVTGTFSICPDHQLAKTLYDRKIAYKERSDPLFLEWQFDKTPEGEQLWRDEVLAIKNEFPIPTT